MKLVDLKLDKKEQEKQESPEIEENEFPWGTRLDLENETLEKFDGLDDVKQGDTIEVSGLASVKSVEISERNGKKTRRLGLQLEELGLERKSKAGKLSDRLQGMKKEDGTRDNIS